MLAIYLSTYRLFYLICWLAMAVCFSTAVSAQSTVRPDNDDFQSWNDISVTAAINKKVDVVFPVTFRFTKNVSRFNEGRVGVGLVLKLHKSFSIAPSYSFIKSRNSAGLFKTENRLIFGLTYRFPTKTFGLSHRSQFERRFRSSGNSWRYRPSVTADKHLPDRWVKGMRVFATEEPFYDSRSRRFSRNRISFGIGKAFLKKLSLDIYYLRQDDNFSIPAVTHVIGTSWKIKL